MPPKKTGSSRSPQRGSTRSTPGGETHQITNGDVLTTTQGIPISDDQNSLKSGARGPTLLEDFVLRDKITHFDHERIPERIVHARGSGAFGSFTPNATGARYSKAAFLKAGTKTEVFVRFSTVAGERGSADLARDVRGFATRFYTSEGNFDLVGNNIPVFFIQDAMKFPDLVHSVKPEPDRGFPQAASAHDTFWDFVSLMPESMHMLQWVMSDRAIPRSYRMMEGFGVHTFRLVDDKGKVRFCKFHWRPVLGSTSVLWDEAVKINGADPDFHRRDLWEAIASGDFPAYDLAVQVFDEKQAAALPFDVLDATKVIPEEDIPLEVIGRMTLDRNPDNFFAETEQVGFQVGNLVPGIDASEDPLFQGRLFSYLDTQLIRLGGPNFHEIPVNKPRCPMHTFQRDGFMKTTVPKGRVSYEPNSLDGGEPRESPQRGFVSAPVAPDGPKVRERSATFADHYSQARLFFRSMSAPEQAHIISAFTFELSKVETVAIRKRMLGHLRIVDADLYDGVANGLGMPGQGDTITPARAPVELDESPTLSLVKKAKPTLRGRKVAIVVTDGSDGALVDALRKAIEKEGAKVAIVAPAIGGVALAGKQALPADHTISNAPSVVFDAVALVPSERGAAALAEEAAPVDWVRDAFGHLKVIGHVAAAAPLLAKAGVEADEGVVALAGPKGISGFIAAARRGRIFEREPALRPPGKR